MNPDDVYMLDGRFGVGITSPHVNIANTVANTATVSTVNKIQGKMLKTRQTITRAVWEDSNKDELKLRMIQQIVKEMIQSKCVEFTMAETDFSKDEITITARIFVTSGDNVQLLRKAGY